MILSIYFFSVSLWVGIIGIPGNYGQVINGSTNVVQNNIELSPIVTTAQGELRGKVLHSRGGRKYYAFLGIPYASPPVFNLRFLPPSSPVPWQGVKNVTEYQSKCVQYNPITKAVEGNEDCLYLNIFAPKFHLKAGVTKLVTDSEESEEDGERFPVMIFIHSGNFMHGSGADYGGKYFMDEKVILITFNYRLGVFGFLNTGDKEAQGNMGLKDQLLALKWINENVDKFGGDRNRITIFGENAGGASVHYHILSPASKQLFNGAISQSGTALCPWAFSKQPKRVARRLGLKLNCPTSDMLELVFCLQGTDANELAQKQVEIAEWSNFPLSPFAPSIETTFDDFDKFLPESPYTLLTKKQENYIPWILGVNEDEGLFEAASILINPQLRSEINFYWHRIAPVCFYTRELTVTEPDAVSNQIRAFYFGSAEIDFQSRKNFSHLFSDRYYVHPNRNSAILHAKINEGKPVYLYYFTHRNHNSKLNELGVGEKLEVTQGDELQYLFDMGNFPVIKDTDEHANFSKKFVQLWVQFAMTGKVGKTWGQKNTTWNPISPPEVKGDTALRYFRLDDEPCVIEEPFFRRMNFWDTLPLREFGNEDNISPYSRNDFSFGQDADY